ncbi:MAG: electron transport complex subunit E [Gammaproteobacteria bacterium]|nr:electron transport complex subunit E [Gammaproteobacteria bacterium]
MNTDYQRITTDGLWHNNPGLVQLLGLCPLLAVSTNVVNALGLGLATVFVMVCSNTTVSLIRPIVKPELRIAVYVMIIASFVTTVELALNAFVHELYVILGIFIPLIVTNCIIIGRAEAFASKNKPLPAALDGLTMGLGFALVLLAIGAVREVIGHGTLFAGMEQMLGPDFAGMKITLVDDYRGFLLAILPPGAFMILGLLIAAKNIIDQRRAKRIAKPVVERRSETSETAA